MFGYAAVGHHPYMDNHITAYDANCQHVPTYPTLSERGHPFETVSLLYSMLHFLSFAKFNKHLAWTAPELVVSVVLV